MGSLEKHLNEISKSFITLEDNKKGKITTHFNKVYKYVTDSMRESNSFFKYIFQRQQLAGSYADHIKVGEPDEYDALVLLRFCDPVVEKGTRPGFVKINIKNGLQKWGTSVDEKDYKDLIDKDGYLFQDKVLAWIRDLIYDVVKSCNQVIKVGNDEYVVEKKASNGPAITLDIQIRKAQFGATEKFSVDFVTALAFNFKEQYTADFVPPFIINKNWNAIAKPNKGIQNKNVEWICSYADMEREFMHDTQKMKQLIRIFKKIRDKENLANLKSYYIKLMFLHQRYKKIDDNKYWNQSLSALFLEMFDIILQHLEKRQLVSFWHKKYNLFSELSEAQLSDIYNKLKKIRENIDKNIAANNPEFIRSVILTAAELKSISNSAPLDSCKKAENQNSLSVRGWT